MAKIRKTEMNSPLDRTACCTAERKQFRSDIRNTLRLIRRRPTAWRPKRDTVDRIFSGELLWDGTLSRIEIADPKTYRRLAADISAPILDLYPAVDAVLTWLSRNRRSIDRRSKSRLPDPLKLSALHIRKKKEREELRGLLEECKPGNFPTALDSQAKLFALVTKIAGIHDGLTAEAGLAKLADTYGLLVRYPAWCEAPTLIRVARIFQLLDELQRAKGVVDFTLLLHALAIDHAHMSAARYDIGLVLDTSADRPLADELKILASQLLAGQGATWYRASQSARDTVIFNDHAHAISLIPRPSADLAAAVRNALACRRSGGARKRLHFDMALGSIFLAFDAIHWRKQRSWVSRERGGNGHGRGLFLAENIGRLYGLTYTDRHLEECRNHYRTEYKRLQAERSMVVLDGVPSVERRPAKTIPLPKP